MEKQTGDNINIDQRESCPWFIVKQTNKNPIRIIPPEKIYIAWPKYRSILNWKGTANLPSKTAVLSYTLINRVVCILGEKVS